MTSVSPIVDCLQYASWSEKIFREINLSGVHAVHATIAYHGTFREMVLTIEGWNQWFEQFPDLIFMGRTGDDVRRAMDEKRTAIFFGFQNPSPIEDDIGLIEICYALGVRFMQLSYNNQSLLATGCYEVEDAGITRFGKQAIVEMNRVGLVIDMSHSAERSTLEAIELSTQPIAITHANPNWWHAAPRNKSDIVLRALVNSGGMLGFSLYPHHLKGGSKCRLLDFCEMVATCAERYGVNHLGIGSDLCQGQPDSVVGWMRNGRWCKQEAAQKASQMSAGFPDQPDWFRSNLDLGNLAKGLAKVGFSEDEISAVMGRNWLRFFDASFAPDSR